MRMRDKAKEEEDRSQRRERGGGREETSRKDVTDFDTARRILRRRGNIVIPCAGHFDIVIIRASDLRLSAVQNEAAHIYRVDQGIAHFPSGRRPGGRPDYRESTARIIRRWKFTYIHSRIYIYSGKFGARATRFSLL